MNGDPRVVIDGIVVEEDVRFTLVELCRACGAERTQLLALVDEGVLDPAGGGPEDWVFSGSALLRALRLVRDLEVSVAGAALVLDLLDEIETLRARLRRAGMR
jgi:chaperone modulatory protein CbpM